jgi:hypothetical protein
MFFSFTLANLDLPRFFATKTGSHGGVQKNQPTQPQKQKDYANGQKYP